MKKKLLEKERLSPRDYEELEGFVCDIVGEISDIKKELTNVLKCGSLTPQYLDKLAKEIEKVHNRELELRKTSLLLIRTFGPKLRNNGWLQRKIRYGYLGDLKTNDIVTCLSNIKKNVMPWKVVAEQKKKCREQITKKTVTLKRWRKQLKEQRPVVDETKRIESKSW